MVSFHQSTNSMNKTHWWLWVYPFVLCLLVFPPLVYAEDNQRSAPGFSVSTYVIKQLLLFRGKRRKHEIMNAVAEPLSEVDIYEIAMWYESVSK